MGKKAVMIIAHNEFRDEELQCPKAILEDAGITVTVASTTKNSVRGMLGAMVKPDVLLKDVRVEDYDAVIFVGGSGATEYWDDPVAHALARASCGSGKVLGAICIAPVTLARSGVLNGKRATVWVSEASELKAAKAGYTARPVEKDGRIITASGPSAAKEFGEELVKALGVRE